MKPIVKWTSGKTWAVECVCELLTKEMLQNGTYIEPFCGSVSLAFALKPSRMILCDLNVKLINTYLVIKAYPGVSRKSNCRFTRYVDSTSQRLFLLCSWIRQRAGVRHKRFFTARLQIYLRACRFIYLNKTGFNGLYRVNSKGYFNTPIGRSSSGKDIDIIQEDKIRNIYHYFNRNSIDFMCGDYLTATAKAKPGGIVVLDPPYTQTNHTSYQKRRVYLGGHQKA